MSPIPIPSSQSRPIPTTRVARLHAYSSRRPDFLRHSEPDVQRALPAATPAVLYARIQNRDERRRGRQSPSQAPHHVQTQAHELPDCTPTCRRPDFLQQSEPDMQRALPAATPAVLYARIQNRDERRQGHLSPSQAPNHVQTRPHEFPDCTPTPVDVPIFCDNPSLTFNGLCQLRRPQSYMLEFKNGASCTRNPIC